MGSDDRIVQALDAVAFELEAGVGGVDDEAGRPIDRIGAGAITVIVLLDEQLPVSSTIVKRVPVG